MEQTQAPTQSIQDINAALLAQYRARQGAGASDKAGQPSFAATLEKIEKQELPAPAAPKPLVALEKPENPTQESAAVEESCAEPKISRSARMACAEKATHVAYEDDTLSLGDLVDLLNPLQHIPLVGSLYRSITGDEIKPDVQVAGSLLFGVATGSVLLSAASGIASAAIEAQTGKEPTIQVAEAIFGSDTVEAGDPLTEEKIVVADAGGTLAGREVVTPQEESMPSVSAAPTPSVVAASTAAMAPGATRVGHTIYTSPAMRSAGKVATTRTTQTAADTTQVPSMPSAENPLGAMIQEQAKAREAGQKLPPQLVQDMMLMALDKYKTAQATTSSGAAATAN